MKSSFKVLWVLIVLFVCVPKAHSASYGAYNFQSFECPDVPQTVAMKINNSGLIVGYTYATSGTKSGVHGFTSDGNNCTFFDSDFPTRYRNSAHGVNDSGYIVGQWAGDKYYGYLFDGASFTSYEVPGSESTSPRDINDNGEIVGSYGDNGVNHSFLYDGTTYSTIGPISSDPSEPITDSQAYGVNDSGLVVGYSWNSAIGNTQRGYLFDGVIYSSIHFPGATQTQAHDINNSDMIVGHYSETGLARGFFYDGEDFSTIKYSGVFNTSVYGINDSNQIVGHYDLGNGVIKGFVASYTTIPDADAGSDQSVSVGDTVTLDGSGSSDLDGNPITYYWMFTALPTASVAQLSDQTAVNPTFTADMPGTYIISLVVNDGFVDSVLTRVIIRATAPCTVADGGITEITKLIACDGEVGDSFGKPAISGDYAIVGAPGDDDKGTDAGAVYIFQNVGGSWIQKAKLIANDGDAGDRFGSVVSISGNYAIVGADGVDGCGVDSGAVYILHRDVNSSWTQQRFLANDCGTGDRFGTALSISGNYAVVGANHAPGGTMTGQAYILERATGIESWSVKRLYPDVPPGGNPRFGSSVSISGTTAMVGSQAHNLGWGAAGQ